MAVLAVLLAAALLWGCSADTQKTDLRTAAESEEEDQGIRIGISFDSFVIERWLRDRDVFTATAQSLGAQVNVQNANGEVKEQIEQIEYLIDKGMDVIVIIAIDGNSLGDVVKKAKDRGIRVICYDRLIQNADTDLYISFDNTRVGTLMGEALAQALPEGGRIFQIQGSSSDNNVSMIREGFEEALQGTGVEIVYSTFCDNWLAELAFEAVNEGLEQNGGTIDGVMCGNDDLAGQAIRALTEHKLAGEIPVVAQDAELSACQRIVEGTQIMTVYKPIEKLAQKAAEAAVTLAKGEEIVDERLSEYKEGNGSIPYLKIEPIGVTKDNIDEVIINSGFHLREDVYLNVKG